MRFVDREKVLAQDRGLLLESMRRIPEKNPLSTTVMRTVLKPSEACMREPVAL